MQTGSVIKRYPHFFIVSAAVVIVLIFLGKDLFFFDEDVFVTSLQSPFMQQGWQRSYIFKQLLKAEHFFFGKNPAGYHIISVMLHLVCAVMGLSLFKKLLKNCGGCFNARQTDTALFIFYLLFLITPVHSEPLSYILAQGVLVFTLFAILTISFFIRAITENRWFLFLSLFFFTLTLLCYEISWMIPFIHVSLAFFYRKQNTPISSKNKWVIVLLYFIVLAAWLYIKAAFISTSLVADYGSITLTNIDFAAVVRNSMVLFVRNFLPPLKNTAGFVSMAVAVILVWTAAVVGLFKKQQKLFVFVVLLTVLVMLSFAPTSLLGIDSHDSESERYVYFSSLFAVMFMAAVITALVRNVITLKITVAFIGVLYAGILFNTTSNYKQGGQFSNKYLTEMARYTRGVKTVYTVNQPSQFYGALMIRALTRLPERTGENYTVINEYMKYLYHNDSTAYITFSAKELSEVPAKLITLQMEPGSSVLYFPETKGLLSKAVVEKKQAAIVALRHDSLFIFR